MPGEKEEWRRILNPFYRSPAPLRKRAAALLVVDMLQYFSSIAKPILPALTGVVETCRSERVPILYTAHSHRDPKQDGGMLGEWWGDLILAGTREAEILQEIAPREGEKVLSKKRYSAFFGTDLEEQLRSLAIEDLIIGGVMSNLCCETTARDAFVRDFRVYFLADGTATSREDLHLATLKNLAFGFAYIVSCEEMKKTLEKAEPLLT